MLLSVLGGMSHFVRFQVLTAASTMFRVVFWDILPCKMIVDRRFRGAYCLHHQGWQYAPLKRRSTIIIHGSTSQKTTLNMSHFVFTILTLLVIRSLIIIFKKQKKEKLANHTERTCNINAGKCKQRACRQTGSS
jgi:hypothetical protein